LTHKIANLPNLSDQNKNAICIGLQHDLSGLTSDIALTSLMGNHGGRRAKSDSRGMSASLSTSTHYLHPSAMHISPAKGKGKDSAPSAAWRPGWWDFLPLSESPQRYANLNCMKN
jgi:hypothetical protein